MDASRVSKKALLGDVGSVDTPDIGGMKELRSNINRVEMSELSGCGVSQVNWHISSYGAKLNVGYIVRYGQG